MLNLPDAIRSQCADLEPALVERHFRRMPPSYVERYAVADIVRHLRLLARLAGMHPVEVEVRPMTSHTYEVDVVGEDQSGTVACITAALAADGFDLEDLHVSSYLDPGPEATPEPWYFVIVLWISGKLGSRSVAEMADGLRQRLRNAFVYLGQGNFPEAQTAAADTAWARGDPTRSGRHQATARPAGHEGLILGGDFRLERKLTTGGMGEVHLATQCSLNRMVAVKLVRHEGTADDDMLARIAREALVLGQFSCAYIVQVLAAGTVPGQDTGIVGWMAMEYMAGGDLAHWLNQHGVPPVEVGTRWFRQALEGLQYAHRRAVLHRDLKPHNLLLTAEGDVKVSDFGLLKLVQRTPAGKAPRAAILGTPHYMSPEQALGERLDERSDIFSLGTTFFHVFSGRLPFTKPTPQGVLAQIAQEEAPRLLDAAPQVPRPLGTLIGRMMARRMEDRYQDVGVILEDLSAYERRGLLRCADGSAIVAGLPPVVVGLDAETQAYEPPAKATDDVVI
jgi:hypothetical protein